MTEEKVTGKESSAAPAAPLATARARDLHISTKHATMVCRAVRYKNTAAAKKFLEDVVAMRRAVPYPRFNFDLGHKPGMAAGRYPVKAAKEILNLIKTVEANAQVRGLNVANLKIITLMANKASIPFGGGRVPGVGKRTHLDLQVKERQVPGQPEKKEQKLVRIKRTASPRIAPEGKSITTDERKSILSEERKDTP